VDKIKVASEVQSTIWDDTEITKMRSPVQPGSIYSRFREQQIRFNIPHSILFVTRSLLQGILEKINGETYIVLHFNTI
jgi:hypothetical protein